MVEVVMQRMVEVVRWGGRSCDIVDGGGGEFVEWCSPVCCTPYRGLVEVPTDPCLFSAGLYPMWCLGSSHWS